MSAPMTCRELTCHGLFAYLRGAFNAKTGRHANVPVDWDTMSNDEKEAYEREEALEYEKGRHVSQFLTCKNPKRFTRPKK